MAHTLPMPTRPFDFERTVPLRIVQPVDTPAAAADRAPELARQPEPRQVGLQVIADRDGLALGHELLFRGGDHDDARGITSGLQATCEVLATAVLDLGLPRRARGLTWFVNVDLATLMGPVVEAVSPDWAVIELLETIVATPEVIARVRDLHQRGYRFALDDIDSPLDTRWTLIEWVEFIKIDWRLTAPANLPAMLTLARWHGVKLIAEKLETQADIDAAKALGFDLMQGHGIARPSVVKAPCLPACSRQVIRRLQLLIQHGASNESIAIALAADPATALRVWQLAGMSDHRLSPMDAPNCLADLIRMLPRHQLQAWLAVLTLTDTGLADRPWTYVGLVNARLMALLARRVAPTQVALSDEAYMLGLLDHIRTTLGIAYRDPDHGVRAGARIEQAARQRSGLLGALLAFVQGHVRQPSGWLPGPLAAMPGLALSLQAIFGEAHRWASERVRSDPILDADGPPSKGRPVSPTPGSGTPTTFNPSVVVPRRSRDFWVVLPRRQHPQ
ncbi:EAL and HDOD domain-containing protein [Leptothrix discophora]|uniref:EAL domain-containing protein n=1 Tax=Leptothrix discophora TaxID=89 RepID=A0ABT9G3D6_LEPDI|nr:EAL domain-containing protein [Leptothrix discophora]MDP4300999.1 EAL domain-containing protein [Leptothrix discophora]